MRVFCFLITSPVGPMPAAGPRSPIARLALSRQEAEGHPLRISEVRQIDIRAARKSLESQEKRRVKRAAPGRKQSQPPSTGSSAEQLENARKHA